MIRGIFAVIVGFVGMAVVVVLGTVIAAKVLLPGTPLETGQRPTPPYLAANLAVSALAAVLGGFLTRTIVGKPDSIYVGVLAGFLLVMSVPAIVKSRGASSNGQPGWYPPVIACVGACGVLAGGLLPWKWR